MEQAPARISRSSLLKKYVGRSTYNLVSWYLPVLPHILVFSPPGAENHYCEASLEATETDILLRLSDFSQQKVVKNEPASAVFYLCFPQPQDGPLF